MRNVIELTTSSEPTPDSTSTTETPSPIDVAAIVAEIHAEQAILNEQDRKDGLAWLEEKWVEHEKSRKTKWIRNLVDEGWSERTDPYVEMPDSKVFRLTRSFETRIQECLAAGLYAEAVIVWLYRRGGHAGLPALKKFLRPHLPVDGNELITEGRDQEVIAEGLSPELRSVIHQLDGVSVERGESLERAQLWFVSTYTFDKYSNATPVFAPQDPDRYPPEEF